MRMVLLGPPGSGKGTQARLLGDQYKIPQISTGEIFRRAIAKGTPLGIEAEKYVSKGELVPDDLTVGLVKERLQEKDAVKGFILDGFPRTIPQAKGIEKMSRELGWELDAVVYMKAPERILLGRLVERETCPICGMMYHRANKPPLKTGICDKCGSSLKTREDDNEETFKKRLAVYLSQTSPLVDYYGTKSLLVEVDGTGSEEEVFQRMNEALGDKSRISRKPIDD